MFNVVIFLDCLMTKGNKQEKILRDWRKQWYVLFTSYWVFFPVFSSLMCNQNTCIGAHENDEFVSDKFSKFFTMRVVR